MEHTAISCRSNPHHFQVYLMHLQKVSTLKNVANWCKKYTELTISESSASPGTTETNVATQNRSSVLSALGRLICKEST